MTPAKPLALSSEDRLEIQELGARYALAMDQNDLTAWMATWSPQGIWEGRMGTYTGSIELKKLFSELDPRTRGKRHLLTNYVIDGDSGQARQTCYMLIVEAKIGGNSTTTAVYQDQLTRLDGKWVFLRRQMNLDS